MRIRSDIANLRFPAVWITGIIAFALVMLITSASAFALIKDPSLQGQIESATETTQIKAILTFANQPSAEIVGSVESRIKVVQRFQNLPMLVVYGYPAQIDSLHGLPGLISVEADRKLDFYNREGTSIAGGIRERDFFKYTGNGVGVAILDSGIDGTHPDVHYPERTVQNIKIECIDTSCLSYMYVENVQNTDTSSGHGTHVAGIAAGDGSAQSGFYMGMAPKAKLVGIGAGETIYITTALAGFDYILSHKNAYNIRVVNCSWGTTGSYDASDAVNVASRSLHDAGITVVFAAGNNGPDNDTLNPYSVAPWVIGVAAAAKNGTFLADFSSRGRPNDPLYHPTLSAPGVSIVSAKSSTPVVSGTSVDTARSQYYSSLSGTSMATPFVTGAVADILQGAPWLTPDQIKGVLTSSAVPMPRYNQYQAGAGLLAVDRAVASATGRSLPLDSAFKVSAISPAAGTTGVTRNPQITLTFSRALDPASVNSSNIYLLDNSGGGAVSVNVQPVGSTQVKVTPAKKLAANRGYSVVVAGGIKSATGYYPITTYVSTFTTASCAIACVNLP